MKKNVMTEPAMYQEIRREWKIKRNEAQRNQDYWNKRINQEGVNKVYRRIFKENALRWQCVASEMSINLEKFKVQNHGIKTTKVDPVVKEFERLINLPEKETDG